MSKKNTINKNYLEELVRKQILKENYGERSSGATYSNRGGGLPTWDGTKKWWTNFGRATAGLVKYLENNYARDIVYKNSAPLQGVAKVRLKESKKWEDVIKSYFMFYSDFKFQDFQCDPPELTDSRPEDVQRSEADAAMYQALEDSEAEDNDAYVPGLDSDDLYPEDEKDLNESNHPEFLRKILKDLVSKEDYTRVLYEQSEKNKRSCDYFANYTGWNVEDSTISWLLKNFKQQEPQRFETVPSSTDISRNRRRMRNQGISAPVGTGGARLKEQLDAIDPGFGGPDEPGRGTIASSDGAVTKECPVLHIDGSPVDSEVQKQFCEYRQKKWESYVKACKESPETGWCKETEDTPKQDRLNIFDESGLPAQGFEDEVAWTFKDSIKGRDSARSTLRSINPKLDSTRTVSNLADDGARLYKIIDQGLKDFFEDPEESDHAWMRWLSVGGYIAYDMAVDEGSDTLKSYMLVPENQFIEGLSYLDKKIKELQNTKNRAERDLQEQLGVATSGKPNTPSSIAQADSAGMASVNKPREFGNALEFVPNFVIKLLSIRILRHFFTHKQLVDEIFSVIGNKLEVGSDLLDPNAMQIKDGSDKINRNDLMRCLKILKRKIVLKIEQNKDLHIAFYRYLILASLDPAHSEVTEQDVIDIENLSDNPGEEFTMGQQLLAFIVVSSPEAFGVWDQALKGTVAIGQGAVAMSRGTRAVPAPPWVKGIITGTVLLGQIAWFFLDPINQFNRKAMEEQYNNLLQDMENQKKAAIDQLLKDIIQRRKEEGQDYDEKQLLKFAEDNFKFNKEQINNIKQAINEAMTELEFEINQKVDQTLTNYSKKGGISTNNLEKRIELIQQYISVGQTLKKSLNQLNQVDIYIDADNFNAAYQAIEETKKTALDLFDQAKVPDTAITLEEQKRRQVKLEPQNPDRDITGVEMKSLLNKYIKDLDLVGETRFKLSEDDVDLAVRQYFLGPLFVNDAQASKELIYSRAGVQDYWANSISAAEGHSSKKPVRLSYSQIRNFNPGMSWAQDFQNKNLQIDDVSAFKMKYSINGFYLGFNQEVDRSYKELIAIPYAFGYDGMINRYGYQGSIFLEDNTLKSYRYQMAQFFSADTPYVIKRWSGKGSWPHMEIQDSHPTGKWYKHLWKYKNGKKDSFDAVESLKARPVPAESGQPNILNLIDTLSVSSMWDYNAQKKLAGRLESHARELIEDLINGITDTQYPGSKGDLTGSDLVLVANFFETYREKIEFDNILVNAFKNIKALEPEINKIQLNAFDFEGKWNSLKDDDKPDLNNPDKKKRFALSKKFIKSGLPKRKIAAYHMINYMKAIEKFVAIDNLLANMLSRGN